MLSERMQRQIDRLLDEAEEAVARRDWPAVRESAEAVLRAGVRAACPKLPGVYGMLGRHGDLIYVGKAKSLRARLMSYFRDSRDPKTSASAHRSPS